MLLEQCLARLQVSHVAPDLGGQLGQLAVERHDRRPQLGEASLDLGDLGLGLDPQPVDALVLGGHRRQLGPCRIQLDTEHGGLRLQLIKP